VSYITKFESAQAELAKTNIWKSNSNPPIFFLLRKLGLNIRPFHYNTFSTNFLASSIWFACVWGVLMWFTVWNSQQMPVLIAVITSILGGVFFGLLMALYYKRSASKSSLTSWDDL